MQSPAVPGQHDASARRTLSTIYQEIHTAQTRAQGLIFAFYPIFMFDRSAQTLQRLNALNWGARDIILLGILAWSGTFENYITLPDREWNPLRDLLKSDDIKRSIFLFSIAYKVPVETPSQAPVHQNLIVMYKQLAQTYKDAHPHTIFVEANDTGSIEKCRYYVRGPNEGSLEMFNLNDNIDLNFPEWLEFPGNAELIDWPQSWPKRLAPWAPRTREGQAVPCIICNLPSDPDLLARPQYCQCVSDPDLPTALGTAYLLEVIAKGPAGLYGTELGVRVLEPIASGHCLGEFVGSAVPPYNRHLTEYETFIGDESYVMPLTYQGIDGPRVDGMFAPAQVCGISAAAGGNWVRFVNDAKDLVAFNAINPNTLRRARAVMHRGRNANVAIIPKVAAGRNRLLCYALRDIEPFEELTMLESPDSLGSNHRLPSPEQIAAARAAFLPVSPSPGPVTPGAVSPHHRLSPTHHRFSLVSPHPILSPPHQRLSVMSPYPILSPPHQRRAPFLQARFPPHYRLSVSPQERLPFQLR